MMFELVKTLTELFGPSGYEDPVQEWLARRWREAGLAVRREPNGNLMARLGGHGPKLVIGAHADEISFRIKSIDDQGFVWTTSGRRDAEARRPEPVPLGHTAQIMTRKGLVEGTFVTVTGHVMTRQQREQYETRGYDWLDFYVDVGAAGKAEAQAMGLHPGLPLVNYVPTRRVGQNIVGKAMDDRAALAVMTALAERVNRDKLAYEVWFASTVQEEVGLVGALQAARGMDLGIILEVGLAGDIPLVDRRQVPVALGGGPVLAHKDAGVHYSTQITFGLADAAGQAGIPVQHATFQNFRSDGLEWIKEGIPTAMIAFPCRHTHSPNETIRESDLEQMAGLLAAFIERSTPDA